MRPYLAGTFHPPKSGGIIKKYYRYRTFIADIEVVMVKISAWSRPEPHPGIMGRVLSDSDMKSG